MIDYAHPTRFSYASRYITIVNAVYRALLITENSSYFNHPSSSKPSLLPTKKEDARIVKLRELYKEEVFKNETPTNQHKLIVDVISEKVSNINNHVNSFIRDIKEERAVRLDSLIRYNFSPGCSKSKLIICKEKQDQYSQIKKTNFRSNTKAQALTAANFIVNQLKDICEELKIKNFNVLIFTAIVAEEIFNHYQVVKNEAIPIISVDDFMKKYLKDFLINFLIKNLDDQSTVNNSLELIYHAMTGERVIIENNKIKFKAVLDSSGSKHVSNLHEKPCLPDNDVIKYRDTLSALVTALESDLFKLLPKEVLIIILLFSSPHDMDSESAFKIIKWNEQRFDAMSNFFKRSQEKPFVKLRTDLDLTVVLKK